LERSSEAFQKPLDLVVISDLEQELSVIVFPEDDSQIKSDTKLEDVLPELPEPELIVRSTECRQEL